MSPPVNTPIRSAWFQPRLGHHGERVAGLGDIDQCIRIILTTPLGTDPLRPTFGCDILPWIDQPRDIAAAQLARAALDALERWEERIAVVSVTPRFEGGDDRIALAVAWRPTAGDGQVAVTEALIHG